jgi:hypothetical protein
MTIPRVQITVYLTAEGQALLRERMRTSGLNASQYFGSRLKNADVRVTRHTSAPSNISSDAIGLARKMSEHMNEIARRINSADRNEPFPMAREEFDLIDRAATLLVAKLLHIKNVGKVSRKLGITKWMRGSNSHND